MSEIDFGGLRFSSLVDDKEKYAEMDITQALRVLKYDTMEWKTEYQKCNHYFYVAELKQLIEFLQIDLEYLEGLQNE